MPGSSRRNSSRISARLRWIAGTRMCDWRSCPSCTISSARSVSCAVMPSRASASLSPISSVASDLTLIASDEPAVCTSRATIALASAASRAQCTTPPAAVTDRSSCSRCTSRCRIAAALISAPRSRSASQSGTSDTTRSRLSRIVCVATRRLWRSCASPSASRAASGNGRLLIRCPPGSPPGARCARRCAGARARRRCASGTSCRAPRTPPRRCRRRSAACRRASPSTCRRS